MCGRFGLWTTGPGIPGFKPSYNIAPGSKTPVWLRESPKKIVLLKWGMGGTIINARSEGITEKYMFSGLIKQNRCLILTNGFYEWKKLNLEGKEEKIPWFFGFKDYPVFCLAGIYNQHGEYAIITTTPNKKISNIHDRMPVIIAKNKEDTWLEPESNMDSVLSLLKPFTDIKMIGYPISYRVNNPANDDPSLITPLK